MIYLSDTTMHPGLFGRGEYDLHVREVDSWDVRAALRAEPCDSAVRDAQAAAFLRVLLGRDIRITDDAVWLTPDDTLFVATVEFDPADYSMIRGCTWQAITISPFWRD